MSLTGFGSMARGVLARLEPHDAGCDAAILTADLDVFICAVSPKIQRPVSVVSSSSFAAIGYDRGAKTTACGATSPRHTLERDRLEAVRSMGLICSKPSLAH
jgi:hypothetical protein